jgi:hypothetical protein
MGPTSYEQSIRSSAARHGWSVTADRNGLLVTDHEKGWVWHRLAGGLAGELYERRHREGGYYLEPGRWVDGGGRLQWLPQGSRLPASASFGGQSAIKLTPLPAAARPLPRLPRIQPHPQQLRLFFGWVGAVRRSEPLPRSHLLDAGIPF